MADVVVEEAIENKIYFIRGKKVMLDRDLAKLYGVQTRALNQAVRRNLERFPIEFLFPLTREEIMNLSQNVISSSIKHAPNVFAFTEQGVAMLSSVLKSKRAIQVNILIMKTFVRIREMLLSHKDLQLKIENLETQFILKFKEHDENFQIVFNAIKRLLEEPNKTENKPKRKIGFHP